MGDVFLTSKPGSLPTNVVYEDGSIVVVHNTPVRTGSTTNNAFSGRVEFCAVAVHSTGDLVATSDRAGNLVLYDLVSQAFRRVRNTTLPASHLCLSAGVERLLYAVMPDSTVRVYHVDSGDMIASLDGHKGDVGAVSQSSDGQTLLTVSSDAAVLWDVSPQQVARKRSMGGTQTGIAHACIASAAGLLVLAFRDDSIIIWDMQTYEVLAKLRLAEPEAGAGLQTMHVAEDGSLLACTASNGCCYIWDLPSKQLVRIVDPPAPATSIVQVAVVSSSVLLSLTADVPGTSATHDSSVTSTAPYPQLAMLDNTGRLLFVELGSASITAVLELEAPASSPVVMSDSVGMASSHGRRKACIQTFALSADARILTFLVDDGRLFVYDVPQAKAFRLAALRSKAVAGDDITGSGGEAVSSGAGAMVMPPTPADNANNTVLLSESTAFYGRKDTSSPSSDHRPLPRVGGELVDGQGTAWGSTTMNQTTEVAQEAAADSEQNAELASRTSAGEEETIHEQSAKVDLSKTFAKGSQVMHQVRTAGAAVAQQGGNTTAASGQNWKQQLRKLPAPAQPLATLDHAHSGAGPAQLEQQYGGGLHQAHRVEASTATAEHADAAPHNDHAGLQSVLQQSQGFGDGRYRAGAHPPFSSSRPAQHLDAAGKTHFQLKAILDQRGSFPLSQRVAAWRFLLRLPVNSAAYSTLVSKGPHSAWHDLPQRYPVKDEGLLRDMLSVLNCMAWWSPVFGKAAFLPTLVFPFVKFFRQLKRGTPVDETRHDQVIFEAVMTVVQCWGRYYFETLPHAPAPLLSWVHALLVQADEPLARHLEACRLSPVQYAWPLLRSFMSEVLDRGAWECLWDHLFTAGHDPSLLIYAVVTFLRHVRSSILQLDTDLHRAPATVCPPALAVVMRSQTPVHMPTFLHDMYELRRTTPAYAHPRANGSVSSDRQASPFCGPAHPIPVGATYPAFTFYPVHTLQHAEEVRARIIAEEQALAARKAMTSGRVHQLRALALEKERQQAQAAMLAEQDRLLARHTEQLQRILQVQRELADDATITGDGQVGQPGARFEAPATVAISNAAAMAGSAFPLSWPAAAASADDVRKAADAILQSTSASAERAALHGQGSTQDAVHARGVRAVRAAVLQPQRVSAASQTFASVPAATLEAPGVASPPPRPVPQQASAPAAVPRFASTSSQVSGAQSAHSAATAYAAQLAVARQQAFQAQGDASHAAQALLQHEYESLKKGLQQDKQVQSEMEDLARIREKLASVKQTLADAGRPAISTSKGWTVEPAPPVHVPRKPEAVPHRTYTTSVGAATGRGPGPVSASTAQDVGTRGIPVRSDLRNGRNGLAFGSGLAAQGKTSAQAPEQYQVDAVFEVLPPSDADVDQEAALEQYDM